MACPQDIGAVEAIVEDMNIKKKVIAETAKYCGENTVIVYYWTLGTKRPEPLESARLRYSWRFRAAA